jgi:uncharacterized protein YggE
VTTSRAIGPAALLAIFSLGLCGIAAAQVSGLESSAGSRSIAVTGTGEAAGRPDQATVNAGIQTVATTVVEASRENQAVVERIMQALDKQGIDRKFIQTTNYSIWPDQRQDPRANGEITITGYNVSNVVNVTINDIAKVGEVLAAVTNAGANSIHGVNFGVKDTAALEQTARAAAMRDARVRAEALAKLAGVELGDVMTISMSSGGGYPTPMVGGARFEMAAPAPGISEGQVSVSVQVYVTYAMR